ncbi:hypothetical protein IE53DRAFT_411624 [Violaceomyces palustris]|uniref:Uncharacterized protein n=1 Tax=Violaceomyces palustris TaxID=1673888 RepID=A0ACD0NUD4_9BASI|nr:hypothetical protein IE53DRAFT_411624 [Violaceomyces palustris]
MTKSAAVGTPVAYKRIVSKSSRVVSDAATARTETEDEAEFFSGEDTGALTGQEDAAEVEDATENEAEDPEHEKASSQAPSEPTTSRPSPPQHLVVSTVGNDRARSGERGEARKLAPEEEEWHLKSERKRRKGGIFGRLAKVGKRKKKDDGVMTEDFGEAATTSTILGRSRSAVNELRSRPTNVVKKGAADTRARSSTVGSRAGTIGRGAANVAIDSGVLSAAPGYKAYGRSSPRNSSRDQSVNGGNDDAGSHTGTERKALLPRESSANPSTIPSEDGEEDGKRSNLGIPDQPPRIGTPVALREAELARSPELVHPYDLEPGEGAQGHSKHRSMAGSLQQSGADIDNRSLDSTPSPLLPSSGPLSGEDATDDRPSISPPAAGAEEVNERDRSSSTSSGLKALAGGALGGLAAMVGYDSLKEKADGAPTEVKEKSAQEGPLVTSTSDVPVETTKKTKKKRKKGKKSKDALKEDTARVAADSPVTNQHESSELPYVRGDSPTQDRDDAELLAANVALEEDLGRKASKKSNKEPRITRGASSTVAAAKMGGDEPGKLTAEDEGFLMMSAGPAGTKIDTVPSYTEDQEAKDHGYADEKSKAGETLKRVVPGHFSRPKKSFLLTPSIAPSAGDTQDLSGGGAIAVGKEDSWLLESLTAQQIHYFVRELATRELVWELDRAWLLTSFDKPVRRGRARSLLDVEDDSRINDFDDTSDEELVETEEDEDEEAVFRLLPEEQSRTAPDLPLLRFLLKNAFCTFPLFVAPEEKLSQYGPDPPSKATIARSYFFTGILPILRAIQSRSLSASVDRHGEGDGTPFSAKGTMGGIKGLLLKWASKYVAAVLRVGPGDPYFGDEQASKASWPWPAPNLLPPEAYYAFRKPVDKIRYGGFEVDIVGIRSHAPNEHDFILKIKRPNRVDEYVVRNEADFLEYRNKLSKDLGAYSFVKPLPRPRGRGDDDDSDLESDGLSRPVRQFGSLGPSESSVPQTARKGARRESLARLDRSVADGTTERRRRYSSARTDGRPLLTSSTRGGDYEALEDGRDLEAKPSQRRTRNQDTSEEDDEGSVLSETTVGRRLTTYRDSRSLPATRLREAAGSPIGGSVRGERSDDDFREVDADVTPRKAQQPQKKSLLPFGLGSKEKGQASSPGPRGQTSRGSLRKEDEQARRRSMGRIRSSTNESRNSVVAFRTGPGEERRRTQPFPNRPGPPPLRLEGRRRRLRNWLRDTLAIREAGHAKETHDFLSVGSFSERGLDRIDRIDMDERKREDRFRRREHEGDAEEAGDDVLELREVREKMWKDCVEGDGFLKIYDTLRQTRDYARLPLPYQKMVSWANLQVARFLYGTFVAGDESRANLARVQDVYESIPWKKLSFAMRQPLAGMVRTWQENLLRKSFLQAMLHVMLEDEPETLEADLDELKRSIGSDTMVRKLRMFVDSPDDLKRLIRRHAVQAGIPLVAAITRGSEHPKLNKNEVQRVMDATKTYQSFMKTQPSYVKKQANKEPGFLLISDLQKALRLLSLQRDGAQVRGMLQDPTIAEALSSLFEPLMEELRRMHKVKNVSGDLLDLEGFLGDLLDHLYSLRARVQDPARSIGSIALMLDKASPGWYDFLTRLAQVDPTVFSFFAWFRHLAMTVGAGSEDLCTIWDQPPSSPSDQPESETLTSSDKVVPPTQDEPGTSSSKTLDSKTMGEINSLSESARRKRNRQMEIACRWAAGDVEEDHPIQVPGDGAGKTRNDPYLPREPRPARRSPGLDRFIRSFREACSVALAR